MNNPEPIAFYPNYIWSNVYFIELENHDIISLFRANGNQSSDIPEIKYNREIQKDIIHHLT